MTQTNNTQIAEPLQLFIDLYNKSFGELVIPFTHRRLSFHASTILYYPQPSEYVANDRIKDAIVGNPEKTIFSFISKTILRFTSGLTIGTRMAVSRTTTRTLS